MLNQLKNWAGKVPLARPGLAAGAALAVSLALLTNVLWSALGSDLQVINKDTLAIDEDAPRAGHTSASRVADADPTGARSGQPNQIPGQATGFSPQDIAALHLFGNAIATTPEAIVNAPETRLKLELKGILVKADGNDGAIIAVSPTEQKNFQLGDTIINDATLHQVTAEQVIIKRGGRFESLSIPQLRLPDSDGHYRQLRSNLGASSANRTDPAGAARSARQPS